MPPGVQVSVSWAHVDDLADRHLELLDDRERERWSRLHRPDDRARFVLGAAVLRSLVADLDGTPASRVVLDRACPRCGDQHGPVTTPGRPWRCSVSHSGSFAVAAVVPASVAGGVGVDLETRCPPDWPELLPRVLAPAERSPEHEREFLALWVRKEAVLKSTGEGLSRPASSVALVPRSHTTWAVEGTAGVTVADLEVRDLQTAQEGDVAAAVAVLADQVHITWRRMSL